MPVRYLLLLICFILSCTAAEASRSRTRGRTRGVGPKAPGAASLLLGSQFTWKYAWRGSDYSSGQWTDYIGGISTDENGTITASSTTTGLADSALPSGLSGKAVKFASGTTSRFDSGTAGGADANQSMSFDDNAGGLHIRYLVYKYSTMPNTTYTFMHVSGSSKGIRAYEATNSSSLNIYFQDGTNTFLATKSVTAATQTWSLVDMVIVDDETTNPTGIICQNGDCTADINIATNQDPGAYSHSNAVRIRSFISTTGESYVLWVSLRNNSPAFTTEDHTTMCTLLGLCG